MVIKKSLIASCVSLCTLVAGCSAGRVIVDPTSTVTTILPVVVTITATVRASSDGTPTFNATARTATTTERITETVTRSIGEPAHDQLVHARTTAPHGPESSKTSTAGAVVYVHNCIGEQGPVNEYMPTDLDQLACADGGMGVTDLAWQSWGGQIAIGIGTFDFNDCQPDCAFGHQVTSRATVNLSEIVTVGGVRYYSWVRVVPTVGQPVSEPLPLPAD